MAFTDGMKSTGNCEWATPQYLFDELNDEFHFTLDPCATDSNHKCEKYYTREQDGLAQSWKGERVFCNPPYGREIVQWVKKCHDEVDSGDCPLAVMLIPARTDTRWFHEYIYIYIARFDSSKEDSVLAGKRITLLSRLW